MHNSKSRPNQPRRVRMIRATRIIAGLAGLLLTGDAALAGSLINSGPSPSITRMPMRMPGDGGIRLPDGPRFPGGMRVPDGPRHPGGIRRPRFPGPIIIGVPSVDDEPVVIRRQVIVEDPDGPPQARRKKQAKPKNQGGGQQTARSGFVPPPNGERRFVANEVILDIDARVSDASLAGIARQAGLTRLESHVFTLTGRKMFRWRINGNRSVTSVIQSLRNGDRRINAAYPNFLYDLTDAGLSPTPASLAPAPQPAQAPALSSEQGSPGEDAADTTREGDPAQYMLTKLRVPEAHRVAMGNNVLVAVIDSGIDSSHPDLAGVVKDVYDVAGGKSEPHAHGTGMAGAIASHGRLVGVAPRVQVLAVRAFGEGGGGAQGTTFNILKGLDWAHSRGARIVNMSFAGPADVVLKSALAAAHKKGVVLIAAAGNAGPKSPPLFPAADPNVIAVTATDVEDKVYAQANRGNHIAVAAPGVDVLVPAPQNSYQLTSGTSVAAAHISGIVALMMERNAKLNADGVRKALTSTAKALGANARASETGAGLADAYQAIMIAAPATAGQSSASGAVRERQ